MTAGLDVAIVIDSAMVRPTVLQAALIARLNVVIGERRTLLRHAPGESGSPNRAEEVVRKTANASLAVDDGPAGEWPWDRAAVGVGHDHGMPNDKPGLRTIQYPANPPFASAIAGRPFTTAQLDASARDGREKEMILVATTTPAGPYRRPT
jgi:hypothetical protein